MEHEIKAPVAGIVRRITVDLGDSVYAGHPLVYIEPSDADMAGDDEGEAVDLEYVRPDLKEVHDRQAATFDKNRPKAV